jgi:hypothetical protein
MPLRKASLSSCSVLAAFSFFRAFAASATHFSSALRSAAISLRFSAPRRAAPAAMAADMVPAWASPSDRARQHEPRW